jgi:hypothetical protein
VEFKDGVNYRRANEKAPEKNSYSQDREQPGCKIDCKDSYAPTYYTHLQRANNSHVCIMIAAAEPTRRSPSDEFRKGLIGQACIVSWSLRGRLWASLFPKPTRADKSLCTCAGAAGSLMKALKCQCIVIIPLVLNLRTLCLRQPMTLLLRLLIFCPVCGLRTLRLDDPVISAVMSLDSSGEICSGSLIMMFLFVESNINLKLYYI